MWRLGAEEYPVIRLGGRNTVEQGQHEADAANGARARERCHRSNCRTVEALLLRSSDNARTVRLAAIQMKSPPQPARTPPTDVAIRKPCAVVIKSFTDRRFRANRVVKQL
jgi:hypothetical protein